MTQPRALFLADVLEDTGNSVNDAAAAELRRLHAENEMLLKTLKMAVRQNEHDMLMTGEELRQARAAIKQAEEKA